MVARVSVSWEWRRLALCWYSPTSCRSRKCCKTQTSVCYCCTMDTNSVCIMYQDTLTKHTQNTFLLVCFQRVKKYKKKSTSEQKNSCVHVNRRSMLSVIILVYIIRSHKWALSGQWHSNTTATVQHPSSVLTTAFFMPVLEAPPPPAMITSPVSGSTFTEYKGKGALYKSGTFFFPIVPHKAAKTHLWKTE